MKILNVWISLGYPNEQVYQLTTTKLFDDLMDEAMPCPGDPRTDEAPILSAFEADQCKIKHMLDDDQDSAEILLEDLKQEYNACSELLEAEYAKAKTDRQICLVELYRGSSRSLAEKIQQDMERIKSKLDVLESYQQLWEGECSTKPDIKPAQDAFEDDLAELVKAPKQPKSKAKKKPKAKRSTKKSGGK